MILLPDEQKEIFDVAVEDILKERGSAICLTDAPRCGLCSSLWKERDNA